MIPELQQYLPFTVLKRFECAFGYVRTLLLQQYLPFTVLKLQEYLYRLVLLGRCNSTYRLRYWNWKNCKMRHSHALEVATVLTVYGIETLTPWPNMDRPHIISCNSTYRLRYWNPFTNVMLFIWILLFCCNSTYRLRYWNSTMWSKKPIPLLALQQYLPFTVLKLYNICIFWFGFFNRCRCNSTYRLRYWNIFKPVSVLLNSTVSCNGTYRLRYWNVVVVSLSSMWNVLCCNSTYRLRYWNRLIDVIFIV